MRPCKHIPEFELTLEKIKSYDEYQYDALACEYICYNVRSFFDKRENENKSDSEMEYYRCLGRQIIKKCEDRDENDPEDALHLTADF